MSASAQDLPTVTVVVTTYNYAKFLPMTLDSALAQDYPEELLEIVVMDDGSTDNTPEIVRGYEERYPGRVRGYRQDNGGYENAISHAFTKATGEIVAILDSDDLWPENKISSQAPIFAQRPEVGLVYCDTEVIDSYGNVLHPSHWRWRGFTPHRGANCIIPLLGPPGNLALASTITVRRSLLERFIPIPELAPFADWWITGSVAQVAELEYVEDVRVGYRMHAANITLGAMGLQAVREGLKSGDARRVLVAHGALERLSSLEAARAWATVENVALNMANEWKTAFLPLSRPTEADRDESVRWIEQASAATESGDYPTAFLRWIRALSFDPYNLEAYLWYADLLPVVTGDAEVADPIPGARSFITLSYLPELVREPQLLASYIAHFDDSDDCTLVINATGIDVHQAVADLTDALDKVGHTQDDLPDALLVTERWPGSELELERRAHALLTRRRPRLRAPAFTAESMDALRERAVRA